MPLTECTFVESTLSPLLMNEVVILKISGSPYCTIMKNTITLESTTSLIKNTDRPKRLKTAAAIYDYFFSIPLGFYLLLHVLHGLTE